MRAAREDAPTVTFVVGTILGLLARPVVRWWARLWPDNRLAQFRRTHDERKDDADARLAQAAIDDRVVGPRVFPW